MQTRQPDIHIARFYGNCQAAVSYTFDDGLLEHYTMVRPRLNALGLKVTFCVIGSKIENEWKGTPCMTWQQLREMANDGHEITNHGFQHRSMEKLSGEALRYEVQHNDTLIYNKVGVFPRTYFYPGNRKTEEGVSFCSQDRVGTRIRQESFGGRRDSLWADRLIERILKHGEWAVTMTHGITIGYDCFTRQENLWEHLEKVASMQDRIWVATFHDVAAYTAERDNITLDCQQEGRVITVTPTMSLDVQLFTHPLTMVVDSDIREVRQGGQKLSVMKKDGKSLIDFNPHGGKIQIKLK